MAELYDKINVLVAGIELDARPVEFELDKDENPIVPLVYETVCPQCGCMIQFKIKEVALVDGKPSIGCVECGAYSKGPQMVKVSGAVQIAVEGQIVESNVVKIQDCGCPFVDPIADKTWQHLGLSPAS
jgi:hypothetical protein